MFLPPCRKKLAGGMTPSISWSLWVMLILILEWTANWQASSFRMMDSVTWTATMNTPCQLSWCVNCTLHCFQGYKEANGAIITVVDSRITHTWWKHRIFSDLRLTNVLFRFSPLEVPTGTQVSGGAMWEVRICYDTNDPRTSPIFQKALGQRKEVQVSSFCSQPQFQKGMGWGAQTKGIIT